MTEKLGGKLPLTRLLADAIHYAKTGIPVTLSQHMNTSRKFDELKDVPTVSASLREALTALGLDVQIRPCPAGGQRFRPEAERLGGKQQFPLLVDPNTNATLYESADIVTYLYDTYAGGDAPSYAAIKALRTSPSMAASAPPAIAYVIGLP